MQKILEVIVVTMVIMLGFIQIPVNYCYANKVSSDILNPSDYKPSKGNATSEEDELIQKANIIITVIRNIGIIISVISLMIIGIKTMMASAEEKSIYKEALPGYILGAIMIFAITLIPSIIYDIVKKW